MKSAVVVACALLLLLSCCASSAAGRRMRSRDAVVATDADRWFDQRVDHFDNTNFAMWKQLYRVNDTYWRGNGFPVFVLLGGEGPLGATATTGHYIMNQWAEELGGLIVAVEHRFYGQSMPTKDMSTSSMKLLSSEQALADFATFIVYVKDAYKAPDSKVLTLGGSYSGALSAWIRQKYPNVVYAADATSAPVFAQLDFTEYLEVVSTSVGDACASAIQQGTTLIEKLLKTSDGRTKLEQEFNTCTALKTDNDQIVFLEYITDSIADVVQYNRDNSAHALMTIDQMCAILTGGNISDTYPSFIDQYNSLYGESCSDSSYDSEVATLKDTDPTAATAAGRSWMWQTCTEFGYYQTGESKSQPFSHRITLDFFLQECQAVFGMPSSQMEVAVNSTNALYGGRGVGSSRIVFTNGSVDPWHALGITKDISSDMPAIYIEGTAHCADMYPPTSGDLPSLTEARTEIFGFVRQWLSE
eukprot:TRINITY_DN671_c0_g2_i11.p2 TRINITY_DN671_c0_g2~~TRINITY_DN671_c0_g2_i11.p2  ORF type:complete len:487 (-),score=123.01 TRINITY_DN671_c0_g2_i11:3164-4579(-)